nr:MAG TPA: hypothetical protein [Caudoviricetes sp.]
MQLESPRVEPWGSLFERSSQWMTRFTSGSYCSTSHPSSGATSLGDLEVGWIG